MTLSEAGPCRNDQQDDWASPIPAIDCAPWCRHGDGHVKEIMRRDQTCWGYDHYVDLSLEEVNAIPLPPTGDNQFPYIVDIPKIGPCAYRGFNQRVCVYLHMYLPSHAEDGGLDTLVRLTATEARQLAADLIAVADEIGDAR